MRAFTCFVLTVLCHCVLAQRTVYFPGFELINMEQTQGLQYSTSKLIKSYIEDNHKFTIILPENLGNGYVERETLDQSIVSAKELGARYVLRGEIHELQGLYVLSLGLYEARNREQVWHDMAKGALEQDLDPLLSRLGRSFFTNKTAKTDIEIDEVTTYDQRGVELAQVKVNHFVGAMLGGKYVLGESTLSGFGLAYTYDASTVLFNLNFEFYPSSNLLLDSNPLQRRLQNGNVNLGIIYPLTRKRTTFYVDGGMEYGYYRIKETINESSFRSTESGIGLYAGLGYLINRNSTVNLRIFSAVSVPLYRVDDQSLTGIRFGLVTSFSK